MVSSTGWRRMPELHRVERIDAAASPVGPACPSSVLSLSRSSARRVTGMIANR